ncbi:hypothetical protein DXG01_002821 [Tephrocybe rancida]|nr:hypothetical protein DXG01_002821 [Tephrocybe rancida]
MAVLPNYPGYIEDSPQPSTTLLALSSLTNLAKAGLRLAGNYTSSYTDVQAKVRDATSNDPWGPSGTQMDEIAQMTYNEGNFFEIVEMLEKELQGKGKDWRHTLKSLIVLDYCLHLGSKNVVIHFRNNLHILSALKGFPYAEDENRHNQSGHIRRKAEDIAELLRDENRLQEERLARALMRDRMKIRHTERTSDLITLAEDALLSPVVPGTNRDELHENRPLALVLDRVVRANGGSRGDDEEDLRPNRNDESQDGTAPTGPQEEEEQMQDLEEPAKAIAKSKSAPQSHRSSSKTLFMLEAIFNEPRNYQCLLKCTNADAQVILELCRVVRTSSATPLKYDITQIVFIKLLDSSNLESNIHRQIITAMQRLAAKTNSFPSYFFLHGPISLANEHAVSSGSFGDIYKATLHNEVLCLKVLRANQSILEKLAKSFARETILWSQLSHPNVLPFYGLHVFRSQLAIISPWAENGSIMEFLKQEKRSVDQIHLANVLVDRSGRAYLADFGLSNIDDPLIAHWTSQSSVASKGGSVRWQAPELHRAESDNNDTEIEESFTVHNTEMSDVYAWGCLCYEIFTGRLPFHTIRLPSAVMLRILEGQFPSRPRADDPAWISHGLTESIWELMEKCWALDPAARPEMSTIVSKLNLEKPVTDPRPDAQWPAGSAMRFRNSESGDTENLEHSLEELDVILSRVTGLEF